MEDINIVNISLKKLKKEKLLKFKFEANKKYSICFNDCKYCSYAQKSYTYVLIDYEIYLKKKTKINKIIDKRILSFISNNTKLKFFNNLTKKELKRLKKILK